MNPAKFPKKGKATHPKTTHPNTNGLHEQFAQTLLSVFCFFKREKGASLYKLSRNCLRKLFVQIVFIWVGGFLGGSSLHEKTSVRHLVALYRLGGRFGYVLFNSVGRGGRGSPRRQEGGIGFLLKIPGGGGGFREGEGPRGREGVYGELGKFWGGGGPKYFILGLKRPPSRATRLRFGYGFESCDANAPRHVKNTDLAKQKPVCFTPFLPVGGQELSGTKTLRFVKRQRLRFSAVCVLKTLQFKTLRFSGTNLKERGQCDLGIACQNAAYLAAICALELQFRATFRGRVAIWEIA